MNISKTMHTDEYEGKTFIEIILLYGFLAFLIINPLILQLGFLLFPKGIKGLSLLQWFQGIIFVFSVLLIPKIFMINNKNRKIFKFLILSIIIFIVISLKSAFFDGLPFNDLLGDIVLYFKYIFFIFFWFFATCLLKDERYARLALVCIAIGASIDVSFKLSGYLTGSGTTIRYIVNGVYASAGSEGISAKATNGSIITSLFIVWFILKRRIWTAFIISIFFLIGVYGTFVRASQLSLLVGFAWVLIWFIFLSKKRPSIINIIQVILIILTLSIIFHIYSNNEHYFASLLQDPLARWTYELEKSGVLGSGRLMFYASTWEWFINADFSSFLFGQGGSGTQNLMYNTSGLLIHTHSDFFDLMSIGGLMGLTLYFYSFYNMFNLTREMSCSSIEYFTSYGIIFCYATASLVTGQMIFPHIMLTLTVSLWCLFVINDSHITRTYTGNEN